MAYNNYIRRDEIRRNVFFRERLRFHLEISYNALERVK